ncbi:hypothetical protein OG223_22975 [Streptomyces sp. NBC_01478]|uniref:hypothetical protein n=1 Tax=Streptomyces sp. NBC_01478 TaxID=2903882 RepID=UPI002E2FE77A|nr:hypothetical protein [Streptomyces sp. NBC_01478]
MESTKPMPMPMPKESDNVMRTAVAVAAVALGVMLVGTYVSTPLNGDTWDVSTSHHGLGDLPLLVAFAVLGSAVVFGVAVRRAAARPAERTGLRALLVAVLGAATTVVFWTGLPVILAAGAAVLARSSHARTGRWSPPAVTAAVLAGVTLLMAGWLALAG